MNDIKRFLQCINEISIESGLQIYIVGGALRDILLSKNLFIKKDFDFLVLGDAREFSKLVSEKFGGIVQNFDAFLTSKISNVTSFQSNYEIDFASARSEVYIHFGDYPKVSLTDDILLDLKRRDFSINALAIKLGSLISSIKENGTIDIEVLKENVIDEFCGLRDLEEKKIKVLHEKSFLDDPTRIYRAFRYKERIGGTFEEKTLYLLVQAIKDGALDTISEKRKEKEIKKINLELDSEKIKRELEIFNIL